MGGDALQSAAAHTAMAAMAYLSNIKSGFLIGKPTEMAGGSVGLGSRLEAGPARRADIYVTKKGLGRITGWSSRQLTVRRAVSLSQVL
jgi:hypothetical protein